jgi:predicted glycosyltransferase
MADILFAVTHLHGIGHLKRTAALARACAAAGLSVVLVSGGRPVRGLDTGAARLVQLDPPLRVRDESFAELLGPDDRPAGEAALAARRRQLLTVLAAEAPRVVVTEMYPFGRRKLRGEYAALVEAAAAAVPRPALVCSVRDLLVDKPADKTAWSVEAAAPYDRILVHGDPELIPFSASFPHAGKLGARIAYTGYVAEPVPRARALPAGEVLVSAGGGAFGRGLLMSALLARPLTRAKGGPWRLLVGDNLPERDFRALRAAAPVGVKVQRARPDFAARLAKCSLSVSQGGYNTTVELLGAGCRAVVVPFTGGGQSEQARRAELLARRGLLTAAPGGDEDPPALARAIDAALAQAAPQAATGARAPELGGTEATVEILKGMAAIVPAAGGAA